MLTYWWYPVSDDTGSDAQYVFLIGDSAPFPITVQWEHRNDQAWIQTTYDLAPYRGRTFDLLFGTYNNGYGGVTAMYVDDVSILACSGQ